MRLTDKERLLLADFYISETYRVFKKYLMEGRQLELAQATPFQQDMEQVLITRGQIIELRNIEISLRKIREKQDKKEKQK